MKKFLWILVAAVAVVACGGKKETPETPATPTSVTFTVNPTSLEFPAEGGSMTFSLATDSKAWSIASTADWMAVDPVSGAGNQTVTVTVSTPATQRRGGTLTITDTSGAKGRGMVSVVQVVAGGDAFAEIVPAPATFDGTKRSSTTYQLLVYSFADSDGDGVGDFKGIQNKLDYLDGMGITALWLSPIHPSDSYHGYDVKDYYTVNPQFGTEQDFKNLVDAAHAKGIEIYIDYVLNHSGKGNAWFVNALTNPDSPYRDYYFFSANPSADYGKFPMLKGTSYESGEWKQAVAGSPKLTITVTDEAVTNGNSAWNLWTWQGGAEGKAVKFVDNGGGKLYLVMEIQGTMGMLVRKYDNWNAGSKFGAKTKMTVALDTPVDLVGEGQDMSFTGSGRYRIELSDYNTETLYYMGAFSDWMPDLNYGAPDDVENNATFKDLAASADKWINMGVDGLRLDAVKHICGGINSYNNKANRDFLKKWYEHCNATYKAAGHSGNIFMVGECWDNHAKVERYYYEGLTSCFEFGYWWVLAGALNSGSAASYVSTVSGFVADHLAIRQDAITSLFMTNHDKCSIKTKKFGNDTYALYRAADDLGKNIAKEKQAAAMMLTSPGKPFVYQGEELGYWRDDSRPDDELLRAPIVWNSSATDVARGWTSILDNNMLKGSISVETQEADAESLLNVYQTWSRLRNTYEALASGTMTNAGLSGSSIASWYMTAGSERLLVIHNVASSEKQVTVADDMTRPVAVLGSAAVNDRVLKLGANSSVVFQL